VDVTVAKISASDLPAQRWLPTWRKLAPERETDPATFSAEMAWLAPGLKPKPAFWQLSIEEQAAALDERFPLGYDERPRHNHGLIASWTLCNEIPPGGIFKA
jgi:hypothetical protein